MIIIKKKSHFVKTNRGGNRKAQGTWLHPKLAVMFSLWVNIYFAIWCDEQIDSIMRGQSTLQFGIWKELQAELAKNEGSKIRASFGSRLMLDRKRDIPELDANIKRLESEIQPYLL